MTVDQLTKQGIDPALAMLPPGMDSKSARVMLLAIALQESELKYRQQLAGNPPKQIGPAKSFWQGEIGGGMVQGVRTHEATKAHAKKLYAARGVEPTNRAIWDAIKVDDILASGLARLLLWSDRFKLPTDEEGGWNLYLRTWRPGAWERGDAAKRAELRAKWKTNYHTAYNYVYA